MAKSPPKLIGKYEIVARIARGGMAAIFLARQPGIGGFSRRVVLKVILPVLGSNPKFIQMFMEEARLASLIHHPNVVQVFDVGKDEDTYFLAMEFIDGLPVGAITRDLQGGTRPLPVPVAGEIVAQACAGLHAAHEIISEDGTSLDIVHRDVSPQNLMISRDGVVKLVDFGIAKAEGSGIRTGAGMVKGKFAYMSPEQVRSIQLDRRSDLFSLGAVFFELLTGTILFQRENELATMQSIIKDPIPEPRDEDPTIPASLNDFIVRTLQRDREDRFDTAAEMGRELRRILGELGHFTSPDVLTSFIDEDCREHLKARKVERLELLTPRAGAVEQGQIIDLAYPEKGGTERGVGWRNSESTPVEEAALSDYVLGTVESQLAEAALAMRSGAPDALAKAAPVVVTADSPNVVELDEGGDVSSALAPTDPAPPPDEPASVETYPASPAEQKEAKSDSVGGCESSSAPTDSTPLGQLRSTRVVAPESLQVPPPSSTPAPNRDARHPSRSSDGPARVGHVANASLRRRLVVGVLGGGLVGVALALALGVHPFPQCGSPVEPSLRWVHSPSISRAELDRGLGPIAEYLERAIGRSIELARAETYGDTVERLISGDAQLASLSPALFVEARRRLEVLPVLAVYSAVGAESDRSFIVARDDSEIRSVEQLEGRTFCAPDPRSATGFLAPRQFLRLRGRDPSALFTKTHFTTEQVRVLEEIVAGRCDVGAVSSTVWFAARSLGVQGDRLRLVTDAGEVPRDVICASPRLPVEELRQLRRALLDFDAARDVDTEDPSPLFVIERFAEVRVQEWAEIEGALEAEERGSEDSPNR